MATKIETSIFNKKIKIPSSSPDILLISAPITVTELPFMAGAALKAIANKAGYSCSTFDLNRMTLKWIQAQESEKKSANLSNFFFDWGSGTIDNCREEINYWTAECVSLIQQYNPKILGISVFTDCSRMATKLIAEQVKKQCPNIKILIGGTGIAKGQRYGVSDSISFAEKLRRDGIIDDYIQGDAEYSFYEFLKNNLDFPGINVSDWQRLDNASLTTIPYPDYSDYDWNLYSIRAIGITGSRGCVRKCTFCDSIVHHKKYTWRSGEDIFEEMIEQKLKHNISHFQFSDSLLNGNMKEFRKLIELLANYNNQCLNPGDKLQYDCYFIFRPKAHFNEGLWKLVAESGCKFLFVGVETFSERVRAHMGKGYNNDDLEFSVEMAAKYKVPVLLMTFVGYPTETEEDFEENIKWLTAHQHYRHNFLMFVSPSMVLLPDTWLDQNKDILNIKVLDPQNRESWVSTENGSTLEIRNQRRERLIQHIKDLNWPQYDLYSPHALLEHILISPEPILFTA
jgi:hypothetical protein